MNSRSPGIRQNRFLALVLLIAAIGSSPASAESDILAALSKQQVRIAEMEVLVRSLPNILNQVSTLSASVTRLDADLSQAKQLRISDQQEIARLTAELANAKASRDSLSTDLTREREAHSRTSANLSQVISQYNSAVFLSDGRVKQQWNSRVFLDRNYHVHCGSNACSLYKGSDLVYPLN